MINSREIVFISTMDYFDLPTRKQRIALKLSETNRVIYFEPPRTILSIFIPKKKRKNLMINQNLYIFPLPMILPFGLRFKFINIINSKRLFKYVRKLLEDHSFVDFILWVYLIDYPNLYKRLNSSFYIYDCVDDHSSYGGLRSKKFVNKCEEEVSKTANVIFATTDNLKNKLLIFNKETYKVTNGVDYKYFNNYPLNRTDLDFPLVQRPVIGYIGAIQNWFDFDSINYASNIFKDISFVIIGPCADEIKIKYKKDNIFFLGSKSYNDAPFYINNFDVCLIPFIVNELTINVSPLKFYEYCALGKPIISSPIKQLIDFSSICYIYNNKEELIERINAALSEADQNLINQRKKIANENSWDNKFNFMFKIINEKLNISK